MKHTNPPTTALAQLLAMACLAMPAAAQWNEIDRSLPFALASCGSANYQIGRWGTAVSFFEQVLRRQPEDPYAHLWLAHALTELGDGERAVDACLEATSFPEVRANALLHLARNFAAQGKGDEALAALEEAALSELVDGEGLLVRDEKLASLRREPLVKRLVKRVVDPERHFRALLESGDGEQLRAFFYANSLSVDPQETESLDLLHEVLEEYGKKIERGREQPDQADRLRIAGKALDETLVDGRGSDYVEAWLSWGPEGIEAQAKRWKSLIRLGGLIRSHRFGTVIELSESIAREAKERGDLLQLYHARVSGSIAHLATLDYRQPRRGVSPETEATEGTRKIREALAVARSLGMVSGIVEALDYLGSLEIHRRAMTNEDFDQLISEAVVLSNRLIPKARELGMWEQMWRDRRSGGDKK